MKQYTETRVLSTTKLRKLCIQHNWYTCGDNDEYAALFAKLHDEEGELVHISTDKLVEIATDIYEHSEIKHYSLEAVMGELASACLIFFDEVKEMQ